MRAGFFASLFGALATFTLADVNMLLGIALACCALTIALPRAIRTVRRTEWKKLVSRN